MKSFVHLIQIAASETGRNTAYSPKLRVIDRSNPMTGRVKYSADERPGMSVAKVVELVGSSNKSFQDAVDTAILRASKTVRGIRGVDVVGQKAVVKSGRVTEYRVNLKVSFAVE